MLGRLKLVIVASAAAMTLAPAMVAAQDGGRFMVLIPYFQPLEGARNNFGRDASEELRDLINTLVTHQAMERGDIEDEADEFNLDMEDLDCLRTIQLASQINVPVAICATYTEDANRNRVVNASIRTIADSEEFVLDQFTVGDRDGDVEAAQQIFSQFDRYNNQVRATAFCSDYAASQQWEDALRQCDAALAINPDATSTRFLRAQLLRELDRNPESLDESRRVLQTDPFHEGALQLATLGGARLLGRADDIGRPSIPPGIYFRMLMVGYFEGIDSQRGIAWRCADSLSLREFLRLEQRERVPDHSWLSKTRGRLAHEVHAEVFGWVLARLDEHGLIQGDRIGVDASTMEANAALRTIVRRDSGEGYRQMLKRMAVESAFTPLSSMNTFMATVFIR